MTKNPLINAFAVFAVIIALVFVFVFYFGLDGREGEDEGMVCTADVMLCTDGSYVGRTSPRCEFAKCPGE